MKKQRSFSLLIAVLSIALMQGCKKYERIGLPCPEVISLSTGAAKYDQTVTVSCSDFRTDLLYSITIGGTPVPADNITNLSAGSLSFRVPKGIGSGSLKVSLTSSPGCQSQGANFIYKYTVNSAGIVNPFAGTAGDNVCEKCFKNPQGLDVDNSGNIFVADQLHYVIKKINPVTRDVTLVAGVNNSSDYQDNSVTFAKFKSPMDVAVTGSGDIYVTDKLSFCIRKISGSQVSTLTGSSTNPGSAGGPLNVARFQDPTGITTDGANLLMVTEPNNRRLRLIDMGNNKVDLLPPDNAATLPFTYPYGVAYTDKRAGEFRVFVADAGYNLAIKGSSLLGTLTSIPSSFIGQAYDLAFDNTGNLFILDIMRKQVVVVYPDNSFEAIAGNNINGPSVFASVSGMAIDKNQKLLYISDDARHTIIQIKLE